VREVEEFQGLSRETRGGYSGSWRARHHFTGRGRGGSRRNFQTKSKELRRRGGAKKYGQQRQPKEVGGKINDGRAEKENEIISVGEEETNFAGPQGKKARDSRRL